MSTPPVKPPGATPGTTGPQGPQTPGKPMAGKVGTSDPWYTYAQQMFPNTEITPEIVAGLKKNMMTMINTTIAEINKRHEASQEYVKRVARGEE